MWLLAQTPHCTQLLVFSFPFLLIAEDFRASDVLNKLHEGRDLVLLSNLTCGLRIALIKILGTVDSIMVVSLDFRLSD